MWRGKMIVFHLQNCDVNGIYIAFGFKQCKCGYPYDWYIGQWLLTSIYYVGVLSFVLQVYPTLTCNLYICEIVVYRYVLIGDYMQAIYVRDLSIYFNSLATERCGCNSKTVISEQMVRVKFMGMSFENVLGWMLENAFDDDSVLVRLMAWCRQIPSD